jgi:hypothetical protein
VALFYAFGSVEFLQFQMLCGGRGEYSPVWVWVWVCVSAACHVDVAVGLHLEGASELDRIV